jgi:tuftelin-interacting protein 11
VGLGALQGPKEEEEEAEDQPVIGTGTARMLHQAAEEKRNKAAREREGSMQRKKVLRADPELAKFENHGKGIGSKLLKLMGWKPGEGLGKAREGIAKPLEAAMRPKGAGLGAVGAEPSLAPKAAAEADKKKDVAQPQSALKQAWKARNRSKFASANVVKSADELVAEQEVAGGVLGTGAAPAMTILDFTGPQTRVVTNMEDLKGGKNDQEDAEVPFPELQHNLKLLVDIAEGDIRRLDAKARLAHETTDMLQQQAKELENEADRLDTELERATNVRSSLCCYSVLF